MSAPDAWVTDSRLPGGMQGGAWLVRSRRTGERAVLKWINVDPDDAYAVVERARSHGYPTPAWLDHGTTDDARGWCVQEYVDGTPMGDLDVPGAHLIVDLVSLQRTITPPTTRTWPLTDAAIDPPHSELVHSDLSVANVLLRDGKVVGVIDFDAAARGCAALDLLAPAANAIVWRSDPRAIDVLHNYARDNYDAPTIAACAASVANDITTWYRHASPDDFSRIESAIETWRASLT